MCRRHLCRWERRRGRCGRLWRRGCHFDVPSLQPNVSPWASAFWRCETSALRVHRYFDARAGDNVSQRVERLSAEQHGNEVLVAFAGHLVVFRAIDNDLTKGVFSRLPVAARECACFGRADLVEYSEQIHISVWFYWSSAKIFLSVMRSRFASRKATSSESSNSKRRPSSIGSKL